MRTRDTFESLTRDLAVVVDAVAIYLGFMLAVWARFDSGWFETPAPPPRSLYYYGAGVATLLFLFIFRSLQMYERPQLGHFTEKIPRIVRAIALGLVLSTALAFAIRTEPPFSRIATALSFITVTLCVLIERNVLFQLERHWAKYQAGKKNVVIIGTDPLAMRLKRSLEREPRLRSRITAFFRVGDEVPHEGIPDDLVHVSLEELPEYLSGNEIDEVILSNPSSMSHAAMVEIIGQCEKALAKFLMVPDMFHMLTSKVDMQSVDGIPMLGVGKWPLDYFWNRKVKRLEDIAGALVGLAVYSPVIAVSAVVIKATSPGPVLYRQERCGEHGRAFHLFKLRTMREDAEDSTGPVWATEDDPRKTKIGSFLRRFNLDETPQFWNVLKGEMSLVGPRPERPHFVEQFREDIGRYMWRHAYKPGMTGWAQVNGLRGNTSIQERIKYDLFYLENWSLGLDLKILLKTLFSRVNAY